MAKQRVGIEFGSLHRPLGDSTPVQAPSAALNIPQKTKLEPYMIRIPSQTLADCRAMLELSPNVTLQELLRHAIDLGLQQLKEKAAK